MDLMKWLVFCVACLMLAVAAADSEGAEYDYQGQTYATVVAQGCYSTTGDYDYDGPDGPLPVQEDVPVTSCFTGDRSGMGRYKMTLKNVYWGVDTGMGYAVDVPTWEGAEAIGRVVVRAEGGDFILGSDLNLWRVTRGNKLQVLERIEK